MAEQLFHPEAQAEYQAALTWYNSRSPRSAMRFEAEVDRLLALIDEHPPVYPPYDEEHRFAVMRRFPYSIVYQGTPTRIYVVAIAHSARKPGYWQDRV